MKFGVSLSAIAQQPAGADMQQAFADICAYVGAARDLGFDMVYQGQHYLTDPYQQLQTMPLLARISAEARGMGLVATMLVPLHHPVDLAERVATMDVITGGNFTLSAALGYRDEEYDNFGVPRRTRVSRYLECLEAMRLLWSGEKVNYEGQYFRLHGRPADAPTRAAASSAGVGGRQQRRRHHPGRPHGLHLVRQPPRQVRHHQPAG